MFLLINQHPSLITSLQLSAGDLTEWARPAVFAAAALASVVVLRDARRRVGFGAASAWTWALLTLLFPPAAVPLYLAARLYTRRAGAADESQHEEVAAAERDSEVKKECEEEDGVDADGVAGSGGPGRCQRRAPTLLYTAALVVAGAAYFYADYRSFDARLARAERAKLYRRPEEAAREYRAALRLREDAHTRKLLGLELLRAGRAAEALDEFGAAARAPDPDDSLHFHTAAALDALTRRAEAEDAYRRFVASRLCAPPSLEERCDEARARLGLTAADR